MADLNVVKTYRYLRIAMIALVAGLGASVLFEWNEVSRRCLQTSISAYYYTPVQGFFVSALVSIGVCLICLKGNTEWEDALLNVAGALAPLVALVPTPERGSCTSVVAPVHDGDANVLNNVTALLVVGGIGVVVTVFLAAASKSSRATWLGVAGAFLLWLVTAIAFVSDRGAFTANAHYTAAIAMFGCIVAVVVLNAVGLGRKTRRVKEVEGKGVFANRYSYVAVGMVVSVIATLLWREAFGFDHAILCIEACLIGLFAAFWIAQTAELWNGGLREPVGAGRVPRLPDAAPSAQPSVG